MQPLSRTSRRYHFTPLRYPGGKTSLFQFFKDVLFENGLRDVLYVERYAGGAGAGLALLLMEHVESIVINDLDPAIYCFWKSVIERTEEFVRLVFETPVNIDEWRRQGEIFRSSDSGMLERGFATFFLNRTNHSGILNGGPIGGISQSGKWKIDARFNKLELARRINLIALYRDRISVQNRDGIEVFADYASNPNSFQYVDPPYYEKGSALYLNSYAPPDHERLAEILNRSSSANWLLTYDDIQPIRDLYCQRKTVREYSIRYQARISRAGSEIVVLSDSLKMPSHLQ